MNRVLKSVITLMLCFSMFFCVEAQAYELSDNIEQNLTLSQNEIDEILAKGYSYTAQERATNLIDSASVAINNDYVMLQFVGVITCSTSVVKCGFEDIIVQRRASASSSWEKFYQFDDNFSDSNSNQTIKAVTTKPGYEYRVKCTAYAKKNILSVQRVDLYTNIIAW